LRAQIRKKHPRKPAIKNKFRSSWREKKYSRDAAARKRISLKRAGKMNFALLAGERHIRARRREKIFLARAGSKKIFHSRRRAKKYRRGWQQ
jgi:hypothetical protein